MAQLLRAAPVLVLVLLPPFLLLAAGPGAEAATASASASSPTLVFLLAGQSNMGGRGGATNGTWDGVVPPDCAPSPRILRLSPSLRWEEAREPLHAGIDLHNVLGVGPGMPFAQALLRSWRSGRRRPAARRPRARPLRAGRHAHRQLVPRHAAVRPHARARQGRPRPWIFQARRAALVPGRGRHHQAPGRRRLHVPHGGIRPRRPPGPGHAGPARHPGRAGRLATGQGKFVDIVRQAQRRVSLHNVKYVDAKGLPVASDYTHLTTPAQVQLGKMLAASYLAATL